MISPNAQKLLNLLKGCYARPDGSIALPPLSELQQRMDGLAKAPLVSCLRRLLEHQLIEVS